MRAQHWGIILLIIPAIVVSGALGGASLYQTRRLRRHKTAAALQLPSALPPPFLGAHHLSTHHDIIHPSCHTQVSPTGRCRVQTHPRIRPALLHHQTLYLNS